MATSVKVDDDTKSRLERLQAEIRPKTGNRVTQQEVLARLVENAIESKAEFVDSFREERVSVAEGDRDSFHGRMVSSGRSTGEEAVDDVLYGRSASSTPESSSVTTTPTPPRSTCASRAVSTRC